MRITDVELYSYDTQILSFGLHAPELGDRFEVKAIYGLDADELIPKFYGYGEESNEKFYRMVMKKRDIVMRLALRPNWANGETYSDLRDDVYRAISRNRSGKIDILFKANGASVMTTSGHIVKLEVPLFNQQPELQLTVRCEDPLFRAYGQVEYLTEDFDNTGYIDIFDGEATAPHGFEMQVTFLAAQASWSISDEATSYDWRLSILPPSSFQIGDTLSLSSEPGKKELYVVSGLSTTSLMDRVELDSKWPLIFPGNNRFYVSGLSTSATRIDFVRFRSAFWGV